jgi:hypothetical protein
MQRPAPFADLADRGVPGVWTTRFLLNIPVFDPRHR